MKKEKKSKIRTYKAVKIGGWLSARREVGIARTALEFAKKTQYKTETRKREIIRGRNLNLDTKIKEQREQAAKVRKEIATRIANRINAISQGQLKNRKILKQGPRPVLDLRRRPEREIPVKQHGFKEEEISHASLLSQ